MVNVEWGEVEKLRGLSDPGVCESGVLTKGVLLAG